MITSLTLLSNQIKSQKIPTYRRFLYDEIDFKERLLGIIGSRGAGKTTLLLQYLKEQDKPRETHKKAINGNYPLDNTNLFSIFCKTPKEGTIRETFFASQLSYSYQLDYPKNGDFIVDEISTFEVGGRSKTNKQIKDVSNAYIVSDDIEIGAGHKIPLWLFGFLY